MVYSYYKKRGMIRPWCNQIAWRWSKLFKKVTSCLRSWFYFSELCNYYRIRTIG
ncbi:hypothetical protein Gohar_001278 [Gossypium harknessii]|uniref:Uncharacterized protein n=1 Tax=Gossypium harknessii TaxID=34285 RepID=A0A7J9I3C7_9ROSI|nr:hypothetical protein [Gossypium harknessii]